MDKKAYMDEQLNVRCFYLRLMKKIIRVPVAAVIGAVIGALLYMAVTRVTQPVLFEAKVQLYLHFVENATNDKVYDYYNAYTWNDLIHSDSVEALLQEASDNAIAVSSYPEGGDFTKETGRDKMGETCMRMYREGTLTLSALQPSDIRVLWITATSEIPDCAAWFAKTASIAMVRYGETNEVFRSIEIIDMEDVAPVTYPQRTKTAAAAGAVIGAVIGLFVLMVLQLLDDAVYVPEDAEKRYGLPVVAVVAGNGKAGTPLECLLEKEAEQFFTRLEKEGKKYVLLTADTTEEERAGADVYLLDAAFGKKNAALTQHVLSQARARGENVEGIVMTGADMSFLAKYYRL